MRIQDVILLSISGALMNFGFGFKISLGVMGAMMFFIMLKDIQ